MGRPSAVRPLPSRLAEIQLLELEAEVMPLLENDFSGLKALEAIRRHREALSMKLAEAHWVEVAK